MSRCLVLGADGFLGSYLTEALLKEGHGVVAFDRFKNGKSKSLNIKQKNLHIYAGNFLNRNDLEQAIRGIDYVFHLISTTTPASSANDPFIDLDTNLRMSVELFQLCAERGVKKVIFPSTGGAIYGRHSSKPFTEADCPNPISPYAISKLAIENYLRYFKRTKNLDYVTYRISNPYGPRQNLTGSQGVIPIFLNNIKSMKPLTVFGKGSMVRDYVYINDAINMIVKSFNKQNKFDVYNLGSGIAVSVNEIIDILRKITGQSSTINHLPIRPTDVEQVVLNVTRFKTEFKIKAKTNLEQGINLVWEYINEQYNEN